MNNRYTDMKCENVARVSDLEPCKPAEPTYTLSHLGQSAITRLSEINEKLKNIEQFVDYSDSGDWGSGPIMPDNLMHNLQVINNILNDIDCRLGRLQEKL